MIVMDELVAMGNFASLVHFGLSGFPTYLATELEASFKYFIR